MTPARKQVNKDITELSTLAPERTLFVGVDSVWDYRKYFHVYETIDIDPKKNPDILGTIESCPSLRDESYDAIIMTGVYEYLKQPDKAFSEINRLLKPGGIALICVPTNVYYHNKRTVEPNDAYYEIFPLLMTRMNVTYYRNQPYYLNMRGE